MIALWFVVVSLSFQVMAVESNEVPPEVLRNLKQQGGMPGGPGGDRKGFKANFGGPCEYACQDGSKPTPRRRHTPKFDGCGFPIDVKGLDMHDSRFDFRGCCNDQDRCYNTCNSVKDDCDDVFLKCAEMWCDVEYGPTGNKPDDEVKKECEKKAATYKSLSKLMACEMYMDGQRDACSCKGEPETSNSSSSDSNSDSSGSATKKKKTKTQKDKKPKKKSKKRAKRAVDEL